MNPPDPNDPFSKTLAAWRVNPKADANFRPAVWQRIKQRTQDSWTAYLRAHLGGWSLVAAIMMMAAGWAGHSVAQAKLEESREKMIVSYLVNLDPRVMAKQRH